MKTALLALSAIAMLAGPALAQDLNPSPYESREQSVEAVSEVEVRGPFRVAILTGSEEASVNLFGPPELLADAHAEVVDGKLVVRFAEGAGWSWNPGSGMHANISLPELTAVGVEGAGSVEVFGVDAEEFTAAVGGAGTIEISRLNAATATFAVGGSGTIEADGTAQQVTYAVGGSGAVEAKRVRAESAKIALGGSGRIYADVSGTAEISLGGSGRVEVVGGATCIKDPPESDRIECR